MQIIEMKTVDLKPYPYNTKKHDQTQVDNVAESIKEFGFVQPLVVDSDNVVVIGHCRLLAAKKLKMKTVPCFRAEDLSEEQTRKLRILDNKTNESPWDFEFLENELADLDLSNYDLDFSFGGEIDENIGTTFNDMGNVDFDEVEKKAEAKKHICPCCGFEFED